MFYNLAATSWDDEEKRALQDVIDGDMFTMGERVARFESAFADYMGSGHAVMVNSGSSANLVGVAALFYRAENPLRRGDEVIVPAIAWATTYHPLQQYGLKLRIVDVELDTLNIDVSQLEAALTPRTRMIVAVSILGNPAALDVLRRFADAHGLILFEDNCESCDAELDGRKTGTFGDLATFSFFYSHHISTMEGGMVITDDTELAHLARSLRAHGWTRGLPEQTPLFRRGQNQHFEAYRFILPGYNLRPSELNAAVGLVQLRKLPAMTAQRRENMALFQQRFGGKPGYLIQRENGKSSSFCFTIVLDAERGPDRERVFKALREADIEFRIITGGNILRHDVLRHYDYSVVGKVTNADIVHDYGFFVGNHPHDLTPQIERLAEVMAGLQP